MKKSVRKNRIRRRKSPAFIIFMLLALALCGLFGWMHLQARLTHLRPAEIYLADLPRAFEGTKILYISDLKLQSAEDAADAKKLVTRLAQLNPDILLLGGDYSGKSILETLNGADSGVFPDYAADFIAFLRNFRAPMGKFAVAGDQDRDLYALAAAFQDAGVQCLSDSAVEIEKDGAKIAVAGLSDRNLGKNGSAKLSRNFSAGDCVIAVAHNAASYVDIRVSEAKGGGNWADLVLSGHTLGGQINIFGRTMRSFSEEERRTLAGWHYANDLPLLVSQGLGCEDIRLRLDSESQVHIITLRKQEKIG